MAGMLTRRKILTGVGALAVPAGPVFAQSKAAKSSPADLARDARKKALADVKVWGVQLRLLNFAELAASPTDMIVIDHGFSDGVHFLHQFERADIERLKTRPDGRRRLVISYISIGEAETYRFYWQDNWTAQPPVWLGAENPRWPGNFPVDYWNPDWQRLIIGGPDSYVSRIMAQGFDGLYLDRADVYEELIKRHPQGAKTMSAFVAKVAAEARSTNPEAIVILQNAEALIAERPIRDSIDAVSKEDLYFGLDHTEDANPSAAIAESERDLKKARAAGKRVFTIEYVTEAARQKVVLDRCAANSFLPYFAPRDLHGLVIDPASLSATYGGPLVPQERPPTR